MWFFLFFQAEDGIRDLVRSRGLGDVYKRQVLLLALGIIAWVNMVSPKQWTVLGRSFGALRLGKHRLREDLDLRDRTLTGLVVLSTLVIAMFAYQVLLFHGWIPHGIKEFGRILLMVAAVIVAQVVLSLITI